MSTAGGAGSGPFCAACGEEGTAGDDHHGRCATVLELDPPRFCARCARRLDVQVYPLTVTATCRTCDGIHPARRSEVRR